MTIVSFLTFLHCFHHDCPVGISLKDRPSSKRGIEVAHLFFDVAAMHLEWASTAIELGLWFVSFEQQFEKHPAAWLLVRLRPSHPPTRMDMIVTAIRPGDILAKMVEGNTDRKTDLIVEIFGTLNLRFKELNSLSYQAAWTDSFCHRRCMHEHQTLIEAAQCAAPHGAGWYVVAVEHGSPRQLLGDEEEIVNKFRFGTRRNNLTI